MNDRFKFRIWYEGKMHYNDFIITSTGYTAKIDEEFLGKCVFNQENLEFDKQVVIMQCTGLKDKNRKLIYEGDIVKYTSIYSGNLTGEVYWDSETLQCKLKLLYSSGEIYADRDLVHFVNKNGLEIVGNIYENKELLECQK